MSNLSPDVLIIGSGPIGCAVARQVFEQRPDTEILMLEAGPQLTSVPGVHVRNIPDEQDRILAQVRSQGPVYTAADLRRATELAALPPTGEFARPGTAYVDPEIAASGCEDTLTVAAISTDVGGMGVHWTCACPHPAGREIPHFVGADEWRRSLQRAQELLCVTQDAFPPSLQGEATRRALARAFGDGLPEGREVQAMPLACQRRPNATIYWTGTDVILGRLATEPPPTFQLRSGTLCRRLIVEGGRVKSAVAVDLETGTEWTVSPRSVMIACDGLRTPQLLWASDIRPAALGRYLNDHIQVMSASVLDPSLIERVAHDPSTAGYRDGRDSGGDPLIGIHWIPYSDQHPYSASVMQLDLSPIGMGSATTTDGKQIVGIGHFIPKEITADDRVTFSDSETDAYGMPKMRIEYRLTNADRREIEAVKTLQAQAAAALGGFDPGREPSLLPNGSSLHYQGTARMGERDDGTSVCDPRCRVWGIANLYVGGNGVIPTPTAGNITLSSVAHAIRAATAITDELALAPEPGMSALRR